MAVDEELWNTEQVRVFLGAKSIRSAMGTINRLGLQPVDREPGRSGMNRYRAGEVIAKVNTMPGRGARTDLGQLGQNLGQNPTGPDWTALDSSRPETGSDQP